MNDLTVDVVAADQRVWSGPAHFVVVRTTEGELGLLAHHTPLLAALVPGEVRIEAQDGTRMVAEVDGGFISAEHDRIAIVAGAVELRESNLAAAE